MKEITRIVAAYYGVNEDDLFTTCKKEEFVKARQMAIYFGNRLLKLPSTKTAKYFRRTHATALYAIRTLDDEIQVSKRRRIEYRELKSLLTSPGLNLSDENEPDNFIFLFKIPNTEESKIQALKQFCETHNIPM